MGVIGMIFVGLGDFHFNQIASYPLFYLSPIMFGVFLILLSSIIGHNIKSWSHIVNPFLWISKNGITVLACHVYLIICSNTVLKALKLSSFPQLFYPLMTRQFFAIFMKSLKTSVCHESLGRTFQA